MSAQKAAKVIQLTAQSSENHTSIKIRSILKWIKSGHEVRVKIQGKPDRHKAIEAIYSQIEQATKSNVKIMQKVSKPDNIKFILRPEEGAAELEIDDSKKYTSIDLDEIVADKDILSGDFEKELAESIKEEEDKTKKK